MNQENERLYTPKEIEVAGYKGFKMCQATQIEKRKHGLGYYRIGNRVLYSEKHLTDFLSSCEVTTSEEQN